MDHVGAVESPATTDRDIAINGTLTSLVAMLTDRGEPAAVATSALATAGLAAIFGRIVCGYCLDKIFGPYVAIGFFVMPMVGIALLATGGSGYRSLVGAILCGSGVGAEIDLMSFLAGRYFGLRAFGKIYGLMFGIFALGTGLGPYLMGLSYDAWHSYYPMLMIFEFALAVTCSLFIRLGPYPFPPHETAVSGIGRDDAAVRRVG
jgi:predicted MFS family arabinose efflux permease